jgi:hypothetical protein
MKFTVTDSFNHSIAVDFHPWTLIKTVKDKLQELLHIKAINQRLFFHNKELKNQRTLIDYSITEGCVLFLATTNTTNNATNINQFLLTDSIQIYGNVPCPGQFKEEIIVQAMQGLSLGLKPKLSEEGTGGTYFLRNRKKQNIAVFKAEDEEPFAPNNPRNYIGPMHSAGFRKGILSGEGAIREVAAYLLDSKSFFGVPATTRVEIAKQAFDSQSQSTPKRGTGLNFAFPAKLSDVGFADSIIKRSSLSPSPSETIESLFSLAAAKRSPSLDFPAIRLSSQALGSKIGALQAYVDFDDFAGDLAAQQFPAKEVWKIAILDIRMFNLDRNEANILVKKRYPAPGENNSDQSTPNSIQQSPALGFSIATHSSIPSTPLDVPGSAQERVFNSLNLPPPILNSHLHGSEMNGTAGNHTGLSPTPLMHAKSVPVHIQSCNSSPSLDNKNSSNSINSSPIPVVAAAGLSRLQARLQALKSNRASSKPVYSLIPIDHSLTLPDTLELAYTDWCWLDWPQVKQPLDEETKRFVMSLDPVADIQLLRNTLCIREPCLRVMRISSILLQKGISAGLTLFQIALIMCRNQLEQPSDLEIMCAQAQAIARQKVLGRKFSSFRKKRDSKFKNQLPQSSPQTSALSPPQNNIESLSLDSDSSSSSVKPSNIAASSTMPISTKAARTVTFETIADPSDSTASLSNSEPINKRNSVLGSKVADSSEVNDLALRRSISHHDFRGFKVSERGFGLSNLVSQSKKKTKARNGCKHLDDDPDAEIIFNNPAKLHNTVSNDNLSGEIHEFKANSTKLTEEEQNEIFFSCLSSLIDTSIERILAKEKLASQQPIYTRASTENHINNNDNHNKHVEAQQHSATEFSSASPVEGRVPSLTRSRSLLQTVSSPPIVSSDTSSIFKGLNAVNVNPNNQLDRTHSNVSTTIKTSPEASPIFYPIQSPPSSEFNSLGFPLLGSPNPSHSSIPDCDSLSSSRLSSEEVNNLASTSESSSVSSSVAFTEFEPLLSTVSLKHCSDFSVNFLNSNSRSSNNAHCNTSNVGSPVEALSVVKSFNSKLPTTNGLSVTVNPNNSN